MVNTELTIQFTKMTGAGNDFVLVDARQMAAQPDWSKFAPAACDRRYGIGADGLLVIAPSEKADFAMLYYNADGSYGGMCGNGGRCAARFVLDGTDRSSVSFEALDYVYRAFGDNSQIRLEMKNPKDIQMNKILHKDGSVISYHFVDTGSPHAVIFVSELPQNLADEIRENGIVEMGRWIRSHRQFLPEGANINFVDTTDLPIVNMRTYERGVEDETLACGTGSVACAVISTLRFAIDSPVAIRTRGGELLSIDFEHSGETFSKVALTGPAKKVFEGTVSWDVSSNSIYSNGSSNGTSNGRVS